MKISVEAKVGTKAYYLSESDNTLIPCVCTGIYINKVGEEYYFDNFDFPFYEYEFDDVIFTDYNLACDALENYRKEMLNE